VPDDELLTISDVVARFRDAGICRSDESRRSYIRELMAKRPPVLEDRLKLADGRQRAGKHDLRITVRSVETFLSNGATAASAAHDQDGRTALQEALARLGQLMDERDADRTRVAGLRREDAARLAEQDLEIAKLKNALRHKDIELDTASEAHSDEREARKTYENVLAQLLGPDDASTIFEGP